VRELLLASLFLLTACAPTSIAQPDTPEPEEAAHPTSLEESSWSAPSVHPLDAKDDATRVVSQYLSLTDQIGADGGEDAQRIQTVVTARWYPREQAGFDEYRLRNIRAIGQTRFDSLEVQSVRVDRDGLLEVAVFLCVDSTGVLAVPTDSPEPPEDLLQWLQRSTTPEMPDDATAEAWNEFLATSEARRGFREPILVWLRGEQMSTLQIDSTENWMGAHPCGGVD
jgi:hypothetical protein